jgi:hypothetical protein
VRYASTRVPTSRDFVVAYRAPVINGTLGKEEQRPIHAKDVEQLVRTEWRFRVPYIVINNVLTVVSHVPTDLQEAPGVHEEGIDHPRIGSAGPENTVPVGRPADGGSRVPAVAHTRVPAAEHTISGVTASGHTPSPSRAAAAALESASAITSPRAADSGSGVVSASPRGLTRPAEDDGPVQGERLSKRQRRHRRPSNISTLEGDTDGPPTERACYLVAAALGTETDDTNAMWDKSKVAEMHSQVLENDTYEVVSKAFLAGRKALASMWACATKSDGRDKSRFLPKGCGQRAAVEYNETWAPVAKLVILRIFLSFVAILQLFTLQMDIKTAFLNAAIKETVFVKPVYDHIFILKLLFASLSDAASRSKIENQIRAFRGGGVMRLKKGHLWAEAGAQGVVATAARISQELGICGQ